MRKLFIRLEALLILAAFIFVVRMANDAGTAAFVAPLLCPNGGTVARDVTSMRGGGIGVNFSCVYDDTTYDANLQFIVFGAALILLPIGLLLFTLRSKPAPVPTE
ncbi:MAG: hypothetical protein U0694_22020 [Anaerolineae bacterium]